MLNMMRRRKRKTCYYLLHLAEKLGTR